MGVAQPSPDAYIEVDVDVQDGDGEFVTGLTRDDFILTEDGIPQAIDRVTLYDVVGISRPERDASHRQGNAPGAARGSQLRVRLRSRVVNRLVVRSARPDSPIGIRAASPDCPAEAVRRDRVECRITVENFLRSWSTREAGVLPWDPIVDETGLTRRFGRGRIDVTDREMSSVEMGLTAAVEAGTANTVVIERARRSERGLTLRRGRRVEPSAACQVAACRAGSLQD